MKKPEQSLYQPNEFADLAGVTVRTLHHYDRIGLFKPSGHTSSGYRLYQRQDLVRLQQIVTLKFIGFSLQQIKELLDSDSFDLATALRRGFHVAGACNSTEEVSESRLASLLRAKLNLTGANVNRLLPLDLD